MSRRERLERKLDKRHEWAKQREQKAETGFASARRALDGIEPGQPILVGHHSQRHHERALERHDSRMRSAVESENMAQHHRQAAAGIRHQLDSSIFSDDSDAVEALQARIAEREAEAARIVAYNASARAAARRGEERGDLSLLTEQQQSDLLRCARFSGLNRGQFPPYKLSNLRGRITADRKRVEEIGRRARRAAEAEDAGGVMLRVDNYGTRIRFAERPPRETINALKGAGFFWTAGEWYGPPSATVPESVKALVAEGA